MGTTKGEGKGRITVLGNSINRRDRGRVPEGKTSQGQGLNGGLKEVGLTGPESRIPIPVY